MELFIEILAIFIFWLICYRKIQYIPRNYMIIFLAVTIVRIVLLWYRINIGLLPMSGADWTVFHVNAMHIIEHANNFFELIHPSNALAITADFYERMVAVLYTIFGVRNSYICMFSYITSEITFILIFNTAFEISQNNFISAIAALVFYSWPMEMIYSTDYLREMPIQCIFALSLLCYVRFLKKNSIINLIMAILGAWFCAGMHSGMVAVLAGYLVVFFFYNSNSKTIKISLTRIVLAAGMLIILFSSGLLNTVTGRFNKLSSIDSVAELNSIQANTDYIGMPSSNLAAVMQTPIRLIYFALAPLPWHIHSSGTLIAFILDGTLRIYVIITIYRTYRMLKYTETRQETMFQALMIVWLAIDLIFSWGTNNFGTAMRHRLKVFPLEIMFIAVLGQSFFVEYVINGKDRT